MAMVYYANKESLDIIVVRNQNEVCRMLLDLLYCKLWKPEQASEPHLRSNQECEQLIYQQL